MKAIIRIDVSAPVSHALALQPVVVAINTFLNSLKDVGVEDFFADYNLNAVDPKRFAKNWAKREAEKAKAKIRDGSGLRHGWALAAEVRRREGQNCGTCRWQTTDSSDEPYCYQTDAVCSELGNGCNAWQPRAAQTGQGE
jgi:hypothetical protein